MNDLTVISVCSIDPTNWKRPVYSKDWVDRLYNSACRNISIPIRFVCLSNDIESQDYEVIPLTTNSWGWWNKIDMFRANLFKGPCLYLDIDNIICKNITDAISKLPQDKLLMPVEPHNNILNSSVMFWNGDYSHIYQHYIGNQYKVVDQYKTPTVRNHTIGDQAYIKDMTEVAVFDDYVPDNFFGWKHHIAGERIDDPSILVFTGTEKPSNNLDLELVQQNWIN